VESAVVRAAFLPVSRVPVADEAALGRLVRAAFGQRRKTLANALRGGGLGTAQRIASALDRAAIDGARRAETLGLEEFARLAEALGPTAGR
jgi:16S rRNA (adenine1518-N6/adenine1519-N6)-dimethyltransferase